MTPERVVTQRRLVGIPVALEDASWYAKYAFPFFDGRWRVRFLALDLLGQRPKVWSGSAEMRGSELRIPASAPALTSLAAEDPARFEGLLHFDPWWTFRGAGLPESLVRAVVPTNVAGRYHLLDVPRRVADVAFDARLAVLGAVETEDETFGRRTFLEGQLELARLRG